MSATMEIKMELMEERMREMERRCEEKILSLSIECERMRGVLDHACVEIYPGKFVSINTTSLVFTQGSHVNFDTFKLFHNLDNLTFCVDGGYSLDNPSLHENIAFLQHQGVSHFTYSSSGRCYSHCSQYNGDDAVQYSIEPRDLPPGRGLMKDVITSYLCFPMFPNLTKLTLMYCEQIPDFIECLKSYYPKLEELTIQTQFYFIQKACKKIGAKYINNVFTSVELPCPRSELERYCQEKGITLKIE